MRRFEPDRYYTTSDPALRVLGARGTLAQWRHRGEGPEYVRFGHRVLYLGSALNAWLDARVIAPVRFESPPSSDAA